MIKAVLFPCEILSIREVDSCYQSEYDAVKKSGEYEIFLYDYEEFVQQGSLHLNRRPEEMTLTVLRGWMLNNIQYENLYNLLLKRKIELITSPEHYANMHLFPRAYPMLVEDTPEILIYPEGRDMEVNLEEIKSKFSRFMVKDFVKSEKNTDFPKFFDSSVTEDDFKNWIKKFKEYRGKLYTGGICIKEYIDLKKYGENTNEWRVFYANEHVLSVSRNSGQKGSVPEVPDTLVEKYKNLPSPFYTVDYAELEDGNWKILEVGDGQVSGLSENQDVDDFFKELNRSNG